jgi:hypothetical protein
MQSMFSAIQIVNIEQGFCLKTLIMETSLHCTEEDKMSGELQRCCQVCFHGGEDSGSSEL